MTRRILKWTIPVDDQRHPIGSGPVVHVDSQYDPGVVTVWTDERDAEHADVTSARVYATGQPLPDHDEVLGTALVLDRALVWHVLRRRSPMRPPPPPGPSSVYAPTTPEDPA